MTRYEYLDIAKGLGILAVVWAHILVVGWSHRFIYAFHMPLFFFISGYLFNSAKYPSFKAFISKRFKRLFIPYVIYSVVTWAIWAVFRYLSGADVESYWMPLLQTFIAQGSGAFFVHNSPLWFIPCLFAVEIMYFFICKAGEIKGLLICFLIAFCGVLLAHQYGSAYLQIMPWNLDAAFYALPFYGLAHVIHKHISHQQVMESVESHRPLSLGIILLLFSAVWYLAMNFGECSMGSSGYNCNEGIFFLRAFIGCFAVVILSAFISTIKSISLFRKTMTWCGTNSLDIMCTHVPIKGIAIILVAKLLHPVIDVSSSGPLSLIAFIITMAVSVPLIMAINKYLRKHNLE